VVCGLGLAKMVLPTSLAAAPAAPAAAAAAAGHRATGNQ